MNKSTSPKKSALEYARRDWAVLPLHAVKNGICSCVQGASCKRPGKHPRTINGVKDATTDRGEIKTWWKKWPNANIGIATGCISGVFVVDVDGKAGKANLEALQAKHDRLPTTVTVKTGHGSHLYFRCDHTPVGNSVSLLGHGLDVRGTGVMWWALGAPTNREQFIASLLDLAQTRSRWLARQSGCSAWLPARFGQTPRIPPPTSFRCRPRSLIALVHLLKQRAVASSTQS